MPLIHAKKLYSDEIIKYCKEGNLKALQDLADNGVDFTRYTKTNIDLTSGYAIPPLIAAAQYNQPKIVEFLLSQFKDKEDKKNYVNILLCRKFFPSWGLNFSALYYSIEHDNKRNEVSDMTKMLVEAGADLHQIYQTKGNVFCLAIGNVKLTQFLLDHGCSIETSSGNWKNKITQEVQDAQIIANNTDIIIMRKNVMNKPLTIDMKKNCICFNEARASIFFKIHGCALTNLAQSFHNCFMNLPDNLTNDQKEEIAKNTIIQIEWIKKKIRSEFHHPISRARNQNNVSHTDNLVDIEVNNGRMLKF